MAPTVSVVALWFQAKHWDERAVWPRHPQQLERGGCQGNTVRQGEKGHGQQQAAPTTNNQYQREYEG